MFTFLSFFSFSIGRNLIINKMTAIVQVFALWRQQNYCRLVKVVKLNRKTILQQHSVRHHIANKTLSRRFLSPDVSIILSLVLS